MRTALPLVSTDALKMGWALLLRSTAWGDSPCAIQCCMGLWIDVDFVLRRAPLTPTNSVFLEHHIQNIPAWFLKFYVDPGDPNLAGMPFGTRCMWDGLGLVEACWLVWGDRCLGPYSKTPSEIKPTPVKLFTIFTKLPRCHIELVVLVKWLLLKLAGKSAIPKQYVVVCCHLPKTPHSHQWWNWHTVDIPFYSNDSDTEQQP